MGSRPSSERLIDLVGSCFLFRLVGNASANVVAGEARKVLEDVFFRNPRCEIALHIVDRDP